MKKQATSIGAVMILVKSKFTENRSITTPLFLPNNQTTYSSGSVYGTTGSANYSGTSTTYGTSVVPITSTQQRFDQTAIFFVKNTTKPRFGLFVVDLSPELRTRLERNTGALVDVVIEDSPAFNANVLPGDVVIEIGGTAVCSKDHALEVMRARDSAPGKCMIKVIRSGGERIIELQLNAG